LPIFAGSKIIENQTMNESPLSIELDILLKKFENIEPLLVNRPVVRALTVDGDESKDFDDAIWVQRLANGWRVDVAVSDVSFLIKPFSALFNRVRKRQVSEYFGTYVRNMFPNVLSDNHLSLIEQEKRPVIHFSISLSWELNVIDFQVHEACLVSEKRMTYSQVARLVVDRNFDDPIGAMLLDAADLSKMLLQRRRDKGALAFFDIQRGLVTNEMGQLLTIEKKETTVAYVIVQEMMILTNTVVASVMASENIPFVFRNHTMKAATPERTDLLEQFQLAMGDTNALSLLGKRMSILSNPASYDTLLNGHYGLNESAYTHVTSPIRRFADLLNHYQLRSYIHRVQPAFNQSDLDVFCKEINVGDLSRKSQKQEHFFNLDKKRVTDKVKENDYNHLISLGDNEFLKILQAGMNLGAMQPELEQACIYRIENQLFRPIDCFTVFSMSQFGLVSEALIGIIKKTISQQRGFASQMIQFLVHAEKMNLVNHQLIDAPAGGFLSRYVGTNTDGEQWLSTMEYAWAHNKRDAQNEAATTWVLAYFDDELVDMAQTVVPSNAALEAPSLQAGELAVPLENYYGKLIEMLRKTNEIKLCKESYSAMGPSHAPIFRCLLPLLFNGETLNFEDEGASKKDAKQMAAAKAIKHILAMAPAEENLNEDNSYPEMPNSLMPYLKGSNYPGTLQIIVQSKPGSLLRYEFNDDPAALPNRYTSHLYLNIDQCEHHFSVEGPSKKEGKKLVAKMALDQLFPELFTANSAE
jgi:hypothetical protein